MTGVGGTVPRHLTEFVEELDRTIATLAERLLALRNDAGHWEGKLASSALSTATAAIALMLHDRASGSTHGARVRGGMRWLAANQNEDGGWGDTIRSASNPSTTALCWAALLMFQEADAASLAEARVDSDAQRREAWQHIIGRAETWLRAQFGDLQPDRLRAGIIARYGADKTFSVPILTVLALSGRLGAGARGWRRVPQLPYELAALPHRFFSFLRLPVVSYALPALVAIGQVRHRHAPTRNPIARLLRSALRRRTLRKLREMQPESGGYLEATPLTAFVVMSLISAGEAAHPVVERGLRFLIASAREDGSWPIDTNLATWVTTWAVKVMAAVGEGVGAELAPPGPAKAGPYGDGDKNRLVEWLLSQQLRHEHPFTHAAPGGWAWTDLSGGVPDADDTAGALVALSLLRSPSASFGETGSLELRASARRGIEWLLAVQNTDGGIPTFCRGWGALPFDRSAPDLTAHAIEAWSAWHAALDGGLDQRVSAAAERAIAYLAASQGSDGTWTPLWFGNQHVEGEYNFVYGTSRVASALTAPLVRDMPIAERCRVRAIEWLIGAQHTDGGWGGGPGAPSSIEETGLALEALGCAARLPPIDDAIARGVRWLIDATDGGRRTPASPIGLYFARLWYFEEMYPILFSLAGLRAAREMGTVPISQI